MRLNVNVENLPIDKVFPNSWNPNEQSDFIFAREKRSIERHNFVVPILVRPVKKGWQIINGEHRWLAAKELDFKEIPANIIEVDEHDAQVLTFITNELHGEPDLTKLGALLQELTVTPEWGIIQETLPYGEEELSYFLGLADELAKGKLPEPSGEGGEPSEFVDLYIAFPIDMEDTVREALAGVYTNVEGKKASDSLSIQRGKSLLWLLEECEKKSFITD
jgi:hypothetical protein